MGCLVGFSSFGVCKVCLQNVLRCDFGWDQLDRFSKSAGGGGGGGLLGVIPKCFLRLLLLLLLFPSLLVIFFSIRQRFSLLVVLAALRCFDSVCFPISSTTVIVTKFLNCMSQPGT